MVPGRDENGRFKKGAYKGGPGRPKRQIEDDFMQLLSGAVTREDWIAICIKAVEQARRGDAVARKWLADYLIGPPVERKEISGENGGAITLKVIYDEK